MSEQTSEWPGTYVSILGCPEQPRSHDQHALESREVMRQLLRDPRDSVLLAVAAQVALWWNTEEVW